MGRAEGLDFETRFRIVSLANSQAIGKKLTRQAFAIMPKIREVDDILRSDPRLHTKIRETHPEVCFAVLNGWKPVPEKKTSAMGRQRRRELLSIHVPGLEEIVRDLLSRYRRTDVQEHDVLDAVVAAVTASLACAGGFPTLPAAPEFDKTGLRMEMVLPGSLQIA